MIAPSCRRQVQTIGALAGMLNIDCDLAFRPSLYVAGGKLDTGLLREEARLRTHLGIEGILLDSASLAARGVTGDGGLLYNGAAEADPVQLARGRLAVGIARGVQPITPAVAMVYETLPDGAVAPTQQGDIVRTRTVLLANGYEMPGFAPVGYHRVVQTWAIASAPSQQSPWSGDALVWEAWDPYLYMRTTAGDRVSC